MTRTFDPKSLPTPFNRLDAEREAYDANRDRDLVRKEGFDRPALEAALADVEEAYQQMLVDRLAEASVADSSEEVVRRITLTLAEPVVISNDSGKFVAVEEVVVRYVNGELTSATGSGHYVTRQGTPERYRGIPDPKTTKVDIPTDVVVRLGWVTPHHH